MHRSARASHRVLPLLLATGALAASLLGVSSCEARDEGGVPYRLEPPPVDEPSDAGAGPPVRDAGATSDADAGDEPTRDDAGTTPEAEDPRVQLLSPSDGASVVNPVTFEVEAEGVTTLRLSADGWHIDTWAPATTRSSTQYTFQGVGYPRALLLEGLNEAGEVLATDARTITVMNSDDPNDWGVQFADNLVENAAAYLDEAWGDISGGTPCVAFFSVGLRRHPDPTRRFPDFYATVTEGPPSEACSIQGRCSLEVRGFSGPHTDARTLKKGDICFTQDVAPFEGELWPDHSYVFVEWVTPGETDFAWVIDNRQEFGAPYVRNITAPTSSSSSFTPFQYFMRSPFQPAP